MKNYNPETIIKGYEQARKDAKEMVTYLDGIEEPAQLEEKNLPTLVSNLQISDSNVRKSYFDTAQIIGGTTATIIGASIGGSAYIGTLGSAGAGLAAACGAAPFIGFLAAPVIAVPLTLKLLKDVKIKKYIKDNQEGLNEEAKAINKHKNRLLEWLQDIQKQSIELENEIKDKVSKQYVDFRDKAKKTSRDIAIQLDDCIHVDVNRRIHQYNEVILNQYRLQKELEENVDVLFKQYNQLLDEKKKCEKEIECIMRILNAMGCPEAVLNQALAEKEEKV